MNADPEAWLADQLAQLPPTEEPWTGPRSMLWYPGNEAFEAVQKLAHEYGEMCAKRATESLENVVTEHGSAFKGGDVQVWVDTPEVEEIYPMANRIRNHQRAGGTVLQREVIIVKDWSKI